MPAFKLLMKSSAEAVINYISIFNDITTVELLDLKIAFILA